MFESEIIFHFSTSTYYFQKHYFLYFIIHREFIFSQNISRFVFKCILIIFFFTYVSHICVQLLDYLLYCKCGLFSFQWLFFPLATQALDDLSPNLIATCDGAPIGLVGHHCFTWRANICALSGIRSRSPRAWRMNDLTTMLTGGLQVWPWIHQSNKKSP